MLSGVVFVASVYLEGGSADSLFSLIRNFQNDYTPTSHVLRFLLMRISIKTHSCLSYLFVQEGPRAAD